MSYTNAAASTRRLGFMTTVSAVALVAASFAARAQTAPVPTAQTAPVAVDEIVVTGTRVVRDGYEAPTPVTVVGVEQMQQMPTQHISDFVGRLPSFGGTAATTTGGGNDISNGRQSQNNLNLRGLDVYRTLVLLDGHRLVSGDANGAVNINDLPQSLISRVDIVTGGASAAYGSDAVAGVVNFVLDRDFQGIKGEMQGGVTNEGDNKSYKFNLTAGTSFANGRGHFIVSGEYAHNDGIFKNGSRDWGFDTVRIIANPAYSSTNTSVPQFLYRSQVGTILATPGGIITTGPLKGTAFDRDGNPYQYQYGTLTNSQFTVGGDWRDSDATQHNQTLANRVTRQNIFARASYDITENINVFATLIESDSNGYARSKLDDSLGNITIRNDNAFLPAAISAQVAALGITSFNMGSFNFDMPPIATDSNRRTWSYAAGAEGKLDAVDTTWTWNLFGQYGLAHSTTYGLVLNRTKFNQALDAVRQADGKVVCRINTDTNPANDDLSCAPWNPFGYEKNSERTVLYSKGAAELLQKRTQYVATFGISGEPFSTWAGAVSIATGIEWRKEGIRSTVDAGSLLSAYTAGNYKPTVGSYTVTEGYVETVVPLATDTSWARLLEFNGAVRLTDYSTSGFVVTYKAGLTYQPFDDLRFRVTRSRDIRAPNLGDLYAGGQGGQSPGILDPFNNNAVLPTFLNNTAGNPDLDAEKADTTGFGVVYQPSFVPGLSASVDYYNIDIKGAINTIGGQETLNRCFLGQQDLCATIQRNAQGVITFINGRPFNLNTLKQRGLDIEASYTTALDALISSWGGDLTLRALGTHVMHSRTDDGFNPVTDDAGNNSSAGPLDWRWLLSASYDLDAFSVAWTGRVLSSGTYAPTYVTCTASCPVSNPRAQTLDYNYIESRFYHDLSFTYRFLDTDEGQTASVYVNVQNVFNRLPPPVAQSSYWYMPTNPFFYDTIGRTFYAGLRFKM